MSDITTALQAISGATFLTGAALKYTKTLVGIYTYITFEPRPVSENPRFTTQDASVIIPTAYAKPTELVECVQRILECDPAEVFIVTANCNVQECEVLMGINNMPQVQVLGVEKLNKRVQILKGLDYVKTKVTILADDDVFWPTSEYLSILLAIFEDKRVGARGTRQRVRRNAQPDIWNFLGIGYLERRTFNNATTNAIDGSISTLSGRTAAYLSEILQTAEFRHYFQNDSWRGLPLNSDDDKCLTRYVYRNKYKISIQFDPRAVLETTVDSGHLYLEQCLRWARAHWRGNFTVMENEDYWCSPEMLWGTYAIYFGSFMTPAILCEAFLFLTLWGAIGGTFVADTAYISFVIFILLTKVVKYVPHLLRHPTDAQFLPLAIAFSYFHGYINIKAAMTMRTTHWGSKDLVALAKPHGDVDEVVERLHDVQHEEENATPGHDKAFTFSGNEYFEGEPVEATEVESQTVAELHKAADEATIPLPAQDATEEKLLGQAKDTAYKLSTAASSSDEAVPKVLDEEEEKAVDRMMAALDVAVGAGLGVPNHSS